MSKTEVSQAACSMWASIIVDIMALLSILPNGELDIAPSATSSSTDFDFLRGRFAMRHRKLKSRLTNCDEWTEFESVTEGYPVLNGLGNIDRLQTEFDGKPFEGLTLRLFNPATRLWSLYWVDSNAAVLDEPMVGSFDGPIGSFYASDQHDGKPVICQFCWDKTDPSKPSWSQALSPDGGETWEWNWYMDFSRV